MATPNKFLEQPARGSLVGVWDTPVNLNMDIVDSAFGGMATIALTNSPVILSSAQYRNNFVTFTGALSGNCAITFPNVGSFYTIQNLTSNTSAFQVTLQSTVAGSQAIGCPWGEAFDIMTDTSGNVKFRNLGRVGSLWDDAGSSVPAWVTNCTIPPYLNCDGSAFSSATYPVLATRLGGTTVPDLRGRYRGNLNQGTARITGAIDGNVNLTSGGVSATTLTSVHVPPVPITDPGHTHTPNYVNQSPNVASPAAGTGRLAAATIYRAAAVDTALASDVISSAVTGITAGNAVAASFSILPPTAIVGITMIRAG